MFANLASKAENNGPVLALSSLNGWSPAILINLEGEQEELGCFERDDDTDARFSCSINWRNQLHVFGGSNEKRQISRLNGYRLERIGTLPFDHEEAACSVMANQFVFLCFNRADLEDRKRCRRSTGPLETFTEIAPSSYKHQYTRTSCSESKSFCLTSN